MKLATVRQDGGTRAAILAGDEFILLDHPDAAGAVVAGVEPPPGPRLPVTAPQLAPPSMQPSKVICAGHNYGRRPRGGAGSQPARPVMFPKLVSALVGAHDPIVLPRASTAMDWEAELAVVVKRRLRHATVDESREAIGGYTVVNDITARDFISDGQILGKSFDQTTPIGPFLVTPEEVDHAQDLEITCEVDGVVMQRSRTSGLLYDAAMILSLLSDIAIVNPGDIVSTGSPPGTGASRNPPVFLRPGQVVRTVIEGIGDLVNVCVAE